MNINAINSYRSVQQLPAVQPSAGGDAAGKASFGDMLSKAVESIGGMEQKADDAVFKLASGQPMELHDAMLAMEEASLGMQLAMQVRTKVVEAYQEVMRMQV